MHYRLATLHQANQTPRKRNRGRWEDLACLPPSILNVPPSASVVPLLWYAKLHPAVFNAMQRSHTAVCGTKNMRLYWLFDALKIMAERVGFEPRPAIRNT